MPNTPWVRRVAAAAAICSHRRRCASRGSDARKEFGIMARIGFGVDGAETERDADFLAIRGSAQDNSFITELQQRLAQKKETAAELVDKLQKMT